MGFVLQLHKWKPLKRPYVAAGEGDWAGGPAFPMGHRAGGGSSYHYSNLQVALVLIKISCELIRQRFRTHSLLNISSFFLFAYQ